MSFAIEGNRTSAGSVDQPKQITFADFYIDSTGLVKIMDFYTIVGNGKDTLHEKSGFYADFQNDSLYVVDFLTGVKESYDLSDKLDYLADVASGSPFAVEFKDFQMELMDSNHAHLSMVVIKHDQGDINIKLDASVEFKLLDDELKNLLAYNPDSLSRSILDLMAVPVTTGEAIFGEIMKTLNKNMLAKGAFIVSMELNGWLGNKKLFSDRMLDSKIEAVPDTVASKVINTFIGHTRP